MLGKEVPATILKSAQPEIEPMTSRTPGENSTTGPPGTVIALLVLGLVLVSKQRNIENQDC